MSHSFTTFTLVSLNPSLAFFSLVQVLQLVQKKLKMQKKMVASHLEPVVSWLAPAQVSRFGSSATMPGK